MTTSYSPTNPGARPANRSEEHTSELQSLRHLVCRLLLEKKKLHRPLLTPHWPAASRVRRQPLCSGRLYDVAERLEVRGAFCRGRRARRLAFFFLKERRPADFYTFSLRAALRI